MNCSFCNKVIRETDSYKHITVDHYQEPRENGISMKDKTKYDLCPNCFKTTGLTWDRKLVDKC
jgi:hypothetical protein